MPIENSRLDILQIAPMWQRSLAALIDMLIVFYSVYFAAGRWGTILSNGARGWSGWAAVFVFCLVGAYWIVPEWLFGFTLGKLLCRVRVVSSLNSSATFSQALKRNLLRPIDFVFFYLVGFIVAMFSPLRQRLGDQWAQTTVVSLRHPASQGLQGHTAGSA